MCVCVCVWRKEREKIHEKTNSNQIIAQDNRCTHQILLSLLVIAVVVVAVVVVVAALAVAAAAIAMRYAMSSAFDKRMSSVYIEAAYFYMNTMFIACVCVCVFHCACDSEILA